MQITITEIAKLKGHEAAIYQLLNHGNGKLYSAGGDGMLVEWDCNSIWPQDGKVIAKSDHPIFALCSARSENFLFFGDFSGDLFRIDINSLEVRRIQFLSAPVYAMQVSEKCLWVGDKLGRLSSWDIESLDVKSQFRLSNKSIRSIQLRDNKILVGDSDGHLHFLDKNSLQIIAQAQKAHIPSVFTAYLHDVHVYSGGRDAHLKQWSHDLTHKQSIPAHMSTINEIAVHPNFPLLATASRDRSIRLWLLPELKLLKVIDNKYNAHSHSVNTLIWWDDKHLISGSDDRTIAIWKITTNS